MYGICETVLALTDGKGQVSVNSENLDEIIWHDNNPNNITNDQIVAKMAELKADYDAKAYARSRKEEYDKLNQYELMYDDKQNSTDNWSKEIKAIKKKYPKN
jgi:hypothetical protein